MFLLLFTCNYGDSVRSRFLLLFVIGMSCVILLWHSLCFPYNYFKCICVKKGQIRYLLNAMQDSLLVNAF